MNTKDQKPSANVEVRPYFATPVAVMRLPDAGDLNQRLAQTIRERMAAHPSTDHSNRGGWQSDWDFAEWGGQAGAALLATARQLADHLTCDRTGRPAGVQWVLNAWANVNGPDHGNEFHTHPGSYWSGTYYVDDGGAGADAALGGEFELQDPRGVAPAMYAPHLAVNVPGGLSIGASELIRPQAGTMLMFPAWLSHCVRPLSRHRHPDLDRLQFLTGAGRVGWREGHPNPLIRPSGPPSPPRGVGTKSPSPLGEGLG